ncbi:hypothetical protein HMI55_003895 [Coelomomyces lativittatus]|nr:hypothetical protein HMI55_003895 [Coelomomyces lativittatus]
MPFLSLSSLLLRRCSHPSLLLFSPRSRSIYDPLNYTLDSTCIFFRAFNSMKETKVTRVLAIETSCDDTSVAILTSERHVIKLLTHHQTKVHELTGGIVPIVAAASHRKELPKLLRNVLEASQLTHEAIDLIAVTQGPGMVPCLSVGLIAAKNLAAVLKKHMP